MASPEEAETTPVERKSGHPRIVAALLVFATVFAVLAIFSTWVNRQALNTDNWVTTSDRILQNEEVKVQLSNYLADQLFTSVDVQAELEQSLPPRLAPLAGPATGALRQLAPKVALRALDSPRAEDLWSTANRGAHQTLLKVLNNEGTAVSTSGGVVTLDLGSLVSESGGQLGVAGKLASKVPPDAGQLTILKSDQLSAAQDISRLIRRLPVALTLLTVLLYGLAIYLAGPRRRQALRSVGFSFVVAGILSLLLRKVAGNSVVDALATTDSVRPAAEAVWSIGTDLLRTIAVSTVTFGILLIVAAWLAGPTRIAAHLRREAAPYLREQRFAAYAVVGFIFLLLVLWAPVAAFHKPLGLLILAALMVAGTEMLRRQTEAEFPEATVGGFGDRLRASVLRRPATEPPAPVEESKVAQIERLSALRNQGMLSEEEFEEAKRSLLDPGPN